MELTAYDYDKRLRRLDERIRESDLSDTVKEALFRYKDDTLLVDGVGKSRCIKRLYVVFSLARKLGKSLAEADEADIKRTITEMEAAGLADWTVQDQRVIIRHFYRWLRKTKHYPPEVEWITLKPVKSVRRPEDLLTQEEIKKLIDYATSPLHRAFIAVLYETGCRVGELMSLQIKHVILENPGFSFTVNGKTGTRRLRIIPSAPYLAEWLNLHPEFDNPEAPLWYSKAKGRSILYPTILKSLKVTAERAGIAKRVNPHSFRHARATYAAKKLTEAEMKALFGWTQSSKMAGVYVHLSGRDTEDAALKLNGLTPSERIEKAAFSPKACLFCNELNEPTNRFCRKCGMLLDTKTDNPAEKELMKKQLGELIEKVMKDESAKKMFFEIAKTQFDRTNSL